MKKADLKTGMQFENAKGDRRVVLLGTANGDVYVEVGGTIHGSLDYYNDDLTSRSNAIPDIVKVYETVCPNQYLIKKIGEHNKIWEREKEVETIEIDGEPYNADEVRERLKELKPIN